MNTTEELSGFEARLLDELQALVEPTSTQAPAPSRPSRWWTTGTALPPRGRLVVGLAVAVMGLLVAPSLVAPQRSAAFAVTRLADGRVYVRVASDFDQANRLERELADVGVEVRIEHLRAHPRLVGTIELLPLGPGGASAAGAQGLELGKGEFWIDPASYRGSVELLIYVTADKGESWQAAPSIFHPDEPLGGLPCAVEGALDTATLERYANQVGITRFEWITRPGVGANSFEASRSPKRLAGDVVGASMKSPSELRVVVQPPGGGAAPRASMDLGLHTGGQSACTPELAGRWR